MSLTRHLKQLSESAVRVLPLRRKPCRYHGKWLWLASPSWGALSSNYEPYMADALRQILRPGDTMLDVGAHHGLWSLYAAQLVGPRGRIVAIEPSDAYDVLATNARPYSQIEPLRTGAGRTDGESVFFGQGGGTTGSFVRSVTEINSRFYTDPIEGTTVPVARLDTLMKRHALAPRLIKIDVEGFEADVLHGASQLLKKRPILIVEIHPPQLQMSGGSDEELLRYLRRAGYNVEVIDRNPNSLYTVLAQPMQ